MLKRSAFKDSISAFRLLIPDGIVDFSPGWRSASDENPGILVGRRIRPRQWVAEGVAIRGASDVSGTPFRVRIHWRPAPGVVVAIAPRPLATICNPCRDKDDRPGIFPILKGIGLQPARIPPANKPYGALVGMAGMDYSLVHDS